MPWKQAIITPVPKTMPVSSVTDLRPICVTPVIPVSRIVERIVVGDYLIRIFDVKTENLTDQYAYKAIPAAPHARSLISLTQLKLNVC